jgi:hypothetical protein
MSLGDRHPPEPPSDPNSPPTRAEPGEAAFRSALGRVMGGTAPAALRAEISESLRHRWTSPDTAETVPSQRRGSLAFAPAPTRPNALAVAASLLLVAGAVLFGIFGPRIGTQVAASSATTVAEVAAVVVSEHAQCTVHDTCGLQSAPWRSLSEAGRELSKLLARSVTAPNLEEAGFSFCCGGQTTIPGAGPQSGHLLYCRHDGNSCTWLSVFAAPVETRFIAADALGRTGPLDCTIHYYEFLAPGAGEVFYFCDGAVTWFVKPSDPTDFEIVRHFFPDSFDRAEPGDSRRGPR